MTQAQLDVTGDATATATERYDGYLMIHKALRALLAETLVRLGAMDSEDDRETRAVLAQVRQMIELGQTHLHKEDAFVHPAMEARAPGSTRRTADEHLVHGQSMARILAGCDAVEQSCGAARSAAALCLYRRFALYLAEDLLHMNVEETENNAVLWATYSDAEIMGMGQRIVASIPPEQNAVYLRSMLTANTPRDRAKMLRAMQPSMPAERFMGLVDSITRHLPVAERDKLVGALG